MSLVEISPSVSARSRAAGGYGNPVSGCGFDADITAVKGGSQCPSCGQRTALRSHRKGFFERLRSKLTGAVPFRCRSCNTRAWMVIDPRDI